MSIGGRQDPAAKSLQVRVSLDRGEELFGDPMTAVGFYHKNVGQVRKGGPICHDTSKPYLPFLWFTASGKIGAENHRIRYRTLN